MDGIDKLFTNEIVGYSDKDYWDNRFDKYPFYDC